MTKRLREKSRVASSVRKTAIMSAAATALIAAAPALSSDASTKQATELQSAIKEILRTPLSESSVRETLAAKPQTPARLSAISIGNNDDIIVGPDETALSHVETVEDIDLVNTGNLTGGVGIEVSTGAINMADAIFDQSGVSVGPGVYRYVYDDAGNVVSTGTPTAEITRSYRDTILNRDPLQSAISIDNSGSITFSGREGVSASNRAGESITIANSGDITSSQDTEGRVGIYATTETYRYTLVETLTDPGEFTYNAYGQLTGIIEPDRWSVDVQRVDMEYDGGAINIHNSGDIDMGEVGALSIFTEMRSAGIYAKGDGGVTINNEGDIKVGRGSFGIRAVTNGATSITQSGRIDIGNASAGISVWRSNGNAGDYRLGGDLYVLNTGDIFGGITRDEAEPGEYVEARGIHVVGLGSNNEYMAGIAHWNLMAAEYNEILGSDVYTIYDAPNLRLYDITTINRGHIELRDGGQGITVIPLAGFATTINEGTIIVGDGAPNFMDVTPLPSAGIYVNNMPHDGMGVTVSINAETGLIVTGDDSFGVADRNYAGDSFAINEGSITTGDGVTGVVTVDGATYNRLFTTTGLYSISFAPHAPGTSSYARNNGSITVGELAVGSSAAGLGDPVLDRMTPTAININEGIISTGDNSIGMKASGLNSTVINTGSITTGSYDISAYTLGEYSADDFAILRAGAQASAFRYAELFNYGTITTGDGKIGAVARSARSGLGYAARVLQGAEGVISTGDDSIGARVHGNIYSFFASEGEISVGDHSVGVDMLSGDALIYYGDTTATPIAGALQAINVGIIETGDNSIGLRMSGVRDVAYSEDLLLPDPNNPGYSYYLHVSGAFEVSSSSYLVNSGAIRVGANSTAVEFTGTAANDQGLLLFNSGTIEATQGSSTALRVNADHTIDSFVVNVGAIAGDVTFGAGDDRFTNTLMVDDAGRVTHTGNIIMSGSVIDFGAGDNVFDNDRGMVTLAGGDNLITGADVVMTLGSIEARNNAIGSSLTIDGNLSGDFAFGADFNREGADQLVITGDIAAGSSISLVLHPTEQLRGEASFSVISVGGENHGDAPLIDGVTGVFADSVVGAEASYSEATGEITVTARFGMGHMGTSATSATTMAQNWWMKSLGALDRRDMQHIVGLEDQGVSVWATAFHEEGSIDPINDLQDVSFDQKLSGLQTGIEWKGDIGGGTFSFGPMFSYGNASAGQNANLASARGDASAYGLNAGYRLGNGFYVNASWQKMAMAIDFTTPGTLSNAAGSTDADGDGFNVELGFAHQLKSGLTLAPQLQYGSVDVELDDFATSDGVYALTDIGGRHSLLRAGLSVSKTFETKNGSITPLADVSYLDAMDGDSTLTSNGLEFGSDASGSGYRAELGVAGRYKTWDITGRVGLSDTTAINSALSTNLSVRYRW